MEEMMITGKGEEVGGGGGGWEEGEEVGGGGMRWEEGGGGGRRGEEGEEGGRRGGGGVGGGWGKAYHHNQKYKIHSTLNSSTREQDKFVQHRSRFQSV